MAALMVLGPLAELASRFGQQLGVAPFLVLETLETLRLHALEKLSARTKFQATGIAQLKVKLAGHVGENLKEYSQGPGMTVELTLQSRGLDLKHSVALKSGIDALRLKLISAGHVIDDNGSLLEQQIKHQSHVMAIILSESEAESRQHQQEAERVAKTREAAEILSSKIDGGHDGEQNYYLQIADQTGKPIDLPLEERKALTLAMTLHEKGRAALKRKQFGEALLLLLEADKEIQKCRAQILDCVDNAAILCLDIVWCYLCLKNVSDLPDAEIRLKACDDCFRKSYGPNLERLALVKGGTGTEKALFMRLHLLQGILAYHQGRNCEARALLDRAENEMKLLLVDDTAMAQVIGMGFSQQEARLALRACEGNIQLAVAQIMKKKEEKEERKKQEREENRKKKLGWKLGKTANGQNVNVVSYETLLSMGFPKGASAEAVRQSNNDISMSLQILQDRPDLLNLPDPDPPSATQITDELIAQVTAMGFDLEAAHSALHRFKGDVSRTIEELLQLGGMVPPDWIQDLANQASPLSSSSGSSANSSSGSTPSKSPEEIQREKEAIDSIIPDIPEEEEDYLDLTLEQETEFLREYRALLDFLV